MKDRVVKPWFFMLTIIIIGFSVISFTGVRVSEGDFVKTIIRGFDDILWDGVSSGGFHITLASGEKNTSPESVAAAGRIIEKRLETMGFADYSVSTDLSEAKIYISAVWNNDDGSASFKNTINDIKKPADVLFVLGTPETPYKLSETDQFILGGGNVREAQVRFTQEENKRYIEIILNEAGARAAVNIREESPYKPVSIWLDDTRIYLARAEDVFTQDGRVQMFGGESGFPEEYAEKLAAFITAGSLPFDMNTVRFEYTAAGEENNVSRVLMLAGCAALLLICIFFVVYYKLPGIVASVSLIGQAAGVLALITGFINLEFIRRVVMSSEGAAGFVITIGVGAYANLIINDRIKIEIRKGKPLKRAIETGYSNSIKSVRGGNVTAMISGIIIMGMTGGKRVLCAWVMKPLFGWFPVVFSQQLYPLGYVLFFGSVLNFIFGVILTRVMLGSLLGYKVFCKRKLFGGSGDTEEERQ